MKKFLSLVMALVMTMSLVTIGAGATEYQDLTDKNEIQYEEAVAVLNKLGIISGYEDGSFRPTGALTRGAAAKIIVSMMIGPDAADALTVSAAPYSDVPVTNTFAAVISYCKTAGYINGYTDGTFRPAGALTGYAFAKMLLGALGYDGAKENFSGSGWTMRVASTGSKAGIFKDIDSFSGNAGVVREVACQMALNTIKGTEVQYAGQNVSVSGENISVEVGNTLATPVPRTGEQLSDRLDMTQPVDNLLQFGEEHFPDLKLANASATEDFQRPATQWTYRNVTIGKFAKTPVMTFTAGASGDTTLDKIRNMGLADYDVVTGTTKLSVNGVSTTPFTTGSMETAANRDALLNAGGTTNYSQNGTLIEVYTSDSTADLITDIVVVQSYVMQVRSISATQVTLNRVESSGVTVTPVTASRNADNYKILSALKADDFVVVTPVRDGSDWKVGSVVVPQTVTGPLTRVSLNRSGNVNGVTVAETNYSLSNNWTVEDADGSPASVLQSTSVNSSVDSTIYLDQYGYMIYAEKIAGSSDYIILDEVYVSNVNNRNHNIVAGWDLNGNALSLDFGTSGNGIGSITTPGAVYAYSTSTANNGSYQYDSAKQGTNVQYVANGGGSYNIGANAIALGAVGGIADNARFASGVKFLFPTTSGTDVTGITVKNGAQSITVGYTVVLNKDGDVSAVVASNDFDVEVSQNVLYVSRETSTVRDTNTNNLVSVFTAYIDGVETTGCVANNTRVSNDSFYTYAVDANGNYTLSAYDQATSRSTAVIRTAGLNRNAIVNRYVAGSTLISANGTPIASNLDLSGATVIDLSGDGYVIGSVSDMVDEFRVNNYTVSMIYNDGTGADKGRVSYIFITDTSSVARTLTVAAGDAFQFAADAGFTSTFGVGSHTVYDGQRLYVRSTTAVQKLTSGVGITLDASPVAQPAAITDLAVYGAIVSGDITADTAATAATNWYTTNVATGTVTVSTDEFEIKLANNNIPTVVEAGATGLKVTVTVKALQDFTSSTTAAATAATVSTTGAGNVASNTLTGDENLPSVVTAGTSTTTATYGIAATQSATAGSTNTYTVTLGTVTGAVTVSIA